MDGDEGWVSVMRIVFFWVRNTNLDRKKRTQINQHSKKGEGNPSISHNPLSITQTTHTHTPTHNTHSTGCPTASAAPATTASSPSPCCAAATTAASAGRRVL